MPAADGIPPTTGTVVEQVRGMLSSLVVVEQAKGSLSYRGDVAVEEAWIWLRTYATAHNEALSEVARAVVTDEQLASQVVDFGRHCS